VADMVEMRPYTRFNKGHYILIIIDVNKHAWPVPQNKEWKRDGYNDSKDNVMIEDTKNLQTDMGKKFYNTNVQKTQHKSLFNIFRNEGVERINIESYIEKRYVETIYA